MIKELLMDVVPQEKIYKLVVVFKGGMGKSCLIFINACMEFFRSKGLIAKGSSKIEVYSS